MRPTCCSSKSHTPLATLTQASATTPTGLRVSGEDLMTAAKPSRDAMIAAAAVIVKEMMKASAAMGASAEETATKVVEMVDSVRTTGTEVREETADAVTMEGAARLRTRIGQSASVQTARGHATRATISAARRAPTLSEYSVAPRRTALRTSRAHAEGASAPAGCNTPSAVRRVHGLLRRKTAPAPAWAARTSGASTTLSAPILAEIW